MRSWNSSRTPSTSSGATELIFISSRVTSSTSRGRILAISAPASSLESCAMKIAALRTPGISGRCRTAGRTAVSWTAGVIPTICSTDASVTASPRWRSSEPCPEVLCLPVTSRARSLHTALAQPAAQHGGDLVGLLVDHGGDLAADPGPLGGLELQRLVVDGRHRPRALDADAVQLGHHVVGELEGLVVLLLVVLPAPGAQPDDQHEQGDAERDAAGLHHRPQLGLPLGLLGRR